MGWPLLADDYKVTFDVRDVTVLWDVSQPGHFRADATGSAPLVGMPLLDNHCLSIEVERGGDAVMQART